MRAQVFDFNDNCRKAYNALIALKLNEGAALIAQEEKRAPDNLIPIYLENYVDFLKIYTSDRRELYNKLRTNKDIRLEILRQGDRDSPYFLFCAGEIELQWASLNIKFGDYLNSIMEIKKAYKFLTENKQRFPDFKPNNKSLGVLYALLGSVPDKYKWGVTLLGMEGSVERGLNDLGDLVAYGKKNDYIYQDETVIYYAFLVFHLLDDKEKAWQILADNGFTEKNSLMAVYSCAHIGIYGLHNEEALKILQGRTQDTAYAAFPFLYYLEGLGKLNKLDTTAYKRFTKFIALYKGEDHLKSAYQKIAWNMLLEGDTIGYMNYILKAENTGATTVDADKQAQREAGAEKPNIHLLRARILFDGGYYERAEKELAPLTENSFATIDEQTEYLYRLGRIYHALKKTDVALQYYDKAIEKGKDLPRYFAANSAFESGLIYELQGNKEKAISYYNMCIGFPNHEYKNGLDQKAKAGLNRLK